MADNVFPLQGVRTWKIAIAYDGTDFVGWQVQPGAATVQGTLAQALLQITGETVLPQGSGRTDAGVHAEGQVVSCDLEAPIPPERLLRALNRRLPSSIRVLSAQIAPPGFHARANVLQKTYEYRIFPRRSLNSTAEHICAPWFARFAWDCRWPLSLHAMQTAAARVVGTHDFTSFAALDPDRTARISAADNTQVPAIGNVRTIFASTWEQRENLLLYRVTGSGFLHHMVRNLVGTFVEIGAGRRSAESMTHLLSVRDRSQAGPTAPPQGLFLSDVAYRDALQPTTSQQSRQTNDLAKQAPDVLQETVPA